MNIKSYNTYKEWNVNFDEFNSSIFLHPDWIESLTSDTIHPIYFDFIDNDKTIGKLSGITNKNRFGKILYCFAGIGVNDIQHNLNRMYASLYHFCQKNLFNRIIISSYDQKTNHKLKVKWFYRTERREFIIPLRETLNYSNQIKRNVKKCQKHNPKFLRLKNYNNTSELFELINHTHRYRLKKQKTDYNPYYLPYLTKDSIKKLLKSRIIDVFITEYNGNTNCIELNLRHHNGVFNLLRGADKSAYHRGFPSGINQYMIQHYKKMNIDTINLGGIPTGIDGLSLARFKKGLGAKEVIQNGFTTNFIQFPYTLLNPILNLGRKLKGIPFIYRLKDKFL
ncbi:hypothetical protein [Carboxylicivirga linearis]|uniref:BioF2-like acetyltransferase domain-containing protein n=1 Tax=Carboxylicivirga linearis TaxID=1628157 RepID=A0ABS5JW08_9BACT|nr:hypothetical protein [Carboxylicivirga linearis]MBS2099093.1 hypothetical protein [Carboxylicivirga linearis]